MKATFAIAAAAAFIAAAPASAATQILLSGTFDAATGLPTTVIDLSSYDLIPGFYHVGFRTSRGAIITGSVQTSTHSTDYCGGTPCGDRTTIQNTGIFSNTFDTGFGRFWIDLASRTGNATDYTINDQEEIASVTFQFVMRAQETGTGTYNFAITRVPEPASWALMIAGFGLAGAVARRRHTPAVA